MRKALPKTDSVSTKRSSTRTAEIQVDFEGIEKERQMMDESLLELMKEKGIEPLYMRPDGYGITAQEYSEKHPGISVDVARRMLDKGIKEGILAKHRMLMDGHSGTNPTVYHRPDEYPPKEKK